MTAPVRPFATLSLDLDDAWAYLRTRGEPDWAEAPSVLPLAVERLLPLLAERGLRITVFVVGRDATRAEGREAIGALAAAGHEIASHSQLHRAELAALPDRAIEDDLREAADAIEALTGRRPTGFRCPSFGNSPALLRSLVEGGYDYDASVLPTSLSPLLKLYYRARMRTGTPDQPQQHLFGRASNALLPLTPFRWGGDGAGLLELPISTMPLLRTPMHMSYLQALGATSAGASHGYLRLALRLLRARGCRRPSCCIRPTCWTPGTPPAWRSSPGWPAPGRRRSTSSATRWRRSPTASTSYRWARRRDGWRTPTCRCAGSAGPDRGAGRRGGGPDVGDPDVIASRTPTRARRLLGSGTVMMLAGTVVAIVGACGFQLLGGRVLGAVAFAPLTVLWSIQFLVMTVVMLPVERLIIRRLELTGGRSGRLRESAVPLAALIGGTAVCVTTAMAILGARATGGVGYVLAAGLLVAGYTVFAAARGYLAGRHRYRDYGIATAAEALVQLVLAAAVLLVTANALALAVVMVLAPLGVLLVRPFFTPATGTVPDEPVDDERRWT